MSMHIGELPEAVQKRSVLRQLHMEITGAAGHYGSDCVFRDGMAFASAGPLPGYELSPWRQVTAAANALEAAAAAPHTVLLQGVLPASYDEPCLQADMKKFAAEAAACGMDFADAGITVSSHTSSPLYFVTAVGSVCQPADVPADAQGDSRGRVRAGQRLLQPGYELVMTRQIALAGTAALAARFGEKLRQRYPYWLIERAKSFERWMSVTEAARAVNRFGPYPMHCLGRGGVFHALWEMAERAGTGLEADLRKIPVMQETIEICEYFDVNPYYLYAAGALLIGTDQAEALIAALAAAGVPAAVIGRVTDKKERVIRNGEDRRYLDRPGQDAWWGIMANGQRPGEAERSASYIV